jgi:hypothetical protein
MVRDTPPYGHARTYQLSLTYLESYGPDKLRWEEAEEAEEEEEEAEEKIRLKQYVLDMKNILGCEKKKKIHLVNQENKKKKRKNSK